MTRFVVRARAGNNDLARDKNINDDARVRKRIGKARKLVGFVARARTVQRIASDCVNVYLCGEK